MHCRLSSSMPGLHLPDATALPSTGVDSQNCHLPSPCIPRVLAWRPLALLPRSAQRTSCLVPSGLVLPLWGPVPRPHHPGPRASLLWPLWRLTALGLGSAAGRGLPRSGSCSSPPDMNTYSLARWAHVGPLGGLQGAPSSCSGVPSTEVSFSEVRVSQEGGERGCCLQLEAPGTLTPFLPSKVNHSRSVVSRKA